MSADESLRLLVIAGDKIFANRFISALRHEGESVALRSLDNLDTVNMALEEHRPNLVLAIEGRKLQLQTIITSCQWDRHGVPVLMVTTARPEPQVSLSSSRTNITVLPKEDFSLLVTSARQLASLQREREKTRSLSRQLLGLEKRQRRILMDSSTATAILKNGVHVFWNRSYRELLGKSDDSSLENTPLLSLVASQEKEKLRAILARCAQGKCSFTLAFEDKGLCRKLSFSFEHNGFGEPGCTYVEARPARGNRRYSREKIAQARQDLITRLENLPFFTTRIETAIATAIESNSASVLMVARINHMEKVEQKLGIAATNQTLNEISTYLKNAVKKLFTASRLADNEFGLLLTNCSAGEGLELARCIREMVNSALVMKQADGIRLSLSIGLASINRDALDAEDMINKARINTGMPLDLPNGEFEDISCCLKKALEARRFCLLFQPLMTLGNNNVPRYEVQARLVTDRKTLLPPATFLPAAVIHNLASRIDRLVIGLLFIQHIERAPAGSLFHIHLSSNSLASLSLLPWLSRQLQKRRFPANRLVFQVSEVDFHSNPDQVYSFCTTLHELGAGITLTRFGSAVDPLPVLEKIRPALVRLDGSLLENLQYSQQEQKRVRTLVRAIHQKNVKVSVTGVEDLDLLPTLFNLGIDLVQGYCISEPGQSMDFQFPKEEPVKVAV